MTKTITPRVGMRVTVHLGGHVTGRTKREHLPATFTGVIYAFDDNGVDVRFFDHFGVSKEAHDMPLLATNEADDGWHRWCRPAPGEPEASPQIGSVFEVVVTDAGLEAFRVEWNTLVAEAMGVPAKLLQPCKGTSCGSTGGKNTVLDWAVHQHTQNEGETTGPVEAETAPFKELQALLNRHSMENASDTPDFLLAEFMDRALDAWNEVTRKRDAWHGFKPGAGITTKPQPMARTTDAPRWDLSGVSTAQMLEELRKREGNEHNVAQPGEDLGCLREKAKAWDGVVMALDHTLGDWLQPGCSAAHSAVNEIHSHTAKSQAWMGVVNALNKYWPEWTDEPFPSGPDCAKRAIAEMAAKAKRLSYADHEAVHGTTESWQMVCSALDKFAPRWRDRTGSGQQCAVAAIEALSRRRELSEDEAVKLATAAFNGQVVSRAGEPGWQPADWVVFAIRAASRGEGGAA